MDLHNTIERMAQKDRRERKEGEEAKIDEWVWSIGGVRYAIGKTKERQKQQKEHKVPGAKSSRLGIITHTFMLVHLAS